MNVSEAAALILVQRGTLRTGHVIERISASSAKAHGLSMKWVREWSSEVDEALDQLPAMSECSDEIFKLLACNPISTPKRLGIVYHGRQPVSVLSLRKRRSFWEPVTSACVPNAIVPSAPGSLSSALRASGLHVHISEMYDHASEMRPTRLHAWDVYRARLDENYEEHWKSTDLWRNIRYARNRTAHLTVAVDRPGDVEWTIERWRETWADDAENLTVAAADMRLSALLMREQGRVTTVTLRDGDVRVAGSINIHRDDVLHSFCLARDSTRPKERLGNRMLDVTFDVGRAKAFRYFDLGGLVDYKRAWAPTDGTRTSVDLVPMLLRVRPAINKRMTMARTWITATSKR